MQILAALNILQILIVSATIQTEIALGYLLKEDGYYLLKEDGGRIII